MSDDIGLQRAIMASLNSAPPPRPAAGISTRHSFNQTTARHSGQGSGIAPIIPRHGGGGNRISGTLAREGIKPVMKKRKPSPGPAKALVGDTAGGGEAPRPKTRDRSSTGGPESDQQRLDGDDKVAPKRTSSFNTEHGYVPPNSNYNNNVRSPIQTKPAPNPKKPAVPKFGEKDPSQKAKESRDQFEAMIEDEILDRSPNVDWDDIASLEEPKRLLNEAVVLPMLMPSFFTGIRTPWKGVLLYGPPGTGKTMLAKAVATTGKTTFFNMSSSSLLSRYHGESEKMVRALFNKARELAPSTIFFDEIDALVSSRGDAEHEVTRRVKTELLMQIDGISSVGEKRVMLLATTNRPWDIDEAMRRRLEKRIYVPLPDAEARKSLFGLYTKTLKFTSTDAPETTAATAGGNDTESPSPSSPPPPTHAEGMDELVERTDGYSGADIQIMCRDAAMMPLRRAIMGLSPAELAAKSAELEAQQDEMEVDLQLDMLGSALKNVKPSVSGKDLQRFAEWTEDFGSV